MDMNLKKKMKNQFKNDNRGSALIVCIIVLLFVSILATVILYMSGVNYRMKKTDYRTRVSFYDAESVLETMQGNLCIPVSEAINNAMLISNSFYAYQGGVVNAREFYYDRFDYELKNMLIDQYGGPIPDTDADKASSTISTIGTSGRGVSGSALIKDILHNLTLVRYYDTTTGAFAYRDGIPFDHIICNDGTVISDDAEYHKNPMLFIEAMAEEEQSPGVKYFSEDGTYLVVGSYVGDTGSDPVTANMNSFIELDVFEKDINGLPTTTYKSDLSKCRVLLKNICVVTVKDGYKSIVTTDLCITIPPFDYSQGADYGTWATYQLMYYVNWQKN